MSRKKSDDFLVHLSKISFFVIRPEDLPGYPGLFSSGITSTLPMTAICVTSFNPTSPVDHRKLTCFKVFHHLSNIKRELMNLKQQYNFSRKRRA